MAKQQTKEAAEFGEKFTEIVIHILPQADLEQRVAEEEAQEDEDPDNIVNEESAVFIKMMTQLSDGSVEHGEFRQLNANNFPGVKVRDMVTSLTAIFENQRSAMLLTPGKVEEKKQRRPKKKKKNKKKNKAPKQ